jgi:hypothetical protein
MLAIPIPPQEVVYGGGTDPVVGWVALAMVLGAAVVAYVVAARGTGREYRPSGVTRLTSAPVH